MATHFFSDLEGFFSLIFPIGIFQNLKKNLNR